MALVSPGVEVTVVDESAYGAPGSGTIPLLVIATRENKTDATNSTVDGIAPFTKAAQAGKVIRVTSQRELTQYFGNPTFTRIGNSIVQGSETSEYGLLAAYSYLGQGAQAFVVRANVDLAQLESTSTEPVGEFSTNNTLWVDTDDSKYGIHQYNSATQLWVEQIPTVETNEDATTVEASGTYTPTATVVNDSYLVVVHSVQNGDITLQYFKGVGGAWEIMDSSAPMSDGTTVTYARHFSAPSTPSLGDVWIKTTSPSNGINLVVGLYTVSTDVFVSQTVQGVTTAQALGLSTSIGDFFPQDGSSNTALTSSSAREGNLLLDLDANTTSIIRVQRINANGAPEALTAFAKKLSDNEPVADPANGQLWFDDTINSLDLYRVSAGGYTPVTAIYQTTAPNSPSNGDVWVDTSNAAINQSAEREYPVIKVYNSALGWITHSNTDQTTARGVIFADITDTAGDNSDSGQATVLSTAPDAVVYPDGMIAVNMAQSKNTVRAYNATAGAWRNAVPNHADGSGRFGRFAQRAYIAQQMQSALTSEDLREPQYNFTLLAAPNYPELTDELVTLNSDRGETGFIIIDTPMRKNPTQAISWVQNIAIASENGEDGLVTNNTYSAVYYPSGQATDPVTGQTVVVPPSHMALYTYAYSDNISFQWFAPAGLTRGVVQNASAVGYITTEGEFKAVSLTQGQRDAMYNAKLNPITTFVGQGTVIFGQKTLHPSTSALDRVNVARLVAYLRDRFDEIARPFIFEINDAQTRERAKLVFERFLADILSRRGIFDFAVVCDESNNTPARIDRNELYIDVAIEPAKVAEFIYIPIRLVNTGTLDTTV